MNPSPFAHLPPMTDDEVARVRARALAVPISGTPGLVIESIAPDEAVATTEMNLRFLAPVHDRAIVTARVLKLGRTLCPLVAELHNEAGRLVAHAGMTYMRVRRDSSARDASRGQGGAR